MAAAVITTGAGVPLRLLEMAKTAMARGGNDTRHGEGDEVQLQRQVDAQQRTAKQRADDGAVAADARAQPRPVERIDKP